MLHKDSARFLAYYLKAYPARSVAMLSLLVISGMLETVGLAMLFPLLSILSAAPNQAPSGFTLRVTTALDRVGLDATAGTLLLIFVAAIFLKSVFMWFAMRQVGYTVAKVGMDLRLELLRALLNARWSHFSSQQPGRFANAISQEATASSAAYRESCSVLAGLIQIVVYVGIFLAISWRVTLITLLAGGALVYGLRRFVEVARQAGQNQVMLAKSLTGRLIDALQGMKAIKAMGEEHQFLRIMEHETRELNETQKRRILATETLKLSQEPMVAAALGLNLYFMIVVLHVDFALMIGMTAIFYRLSREMNTIQMRYQLMASGEASFWSLRAQIELAEGQAEDLSVGGESPTLERELRLDNVVFGYPDRRVLDGVSLTIPAGSFVALVGPSGAGKTTIIDLLVRLHRPQSGAIHVDDVPLERIDVRQWRNSVGYVPQEMLLFSGSVMDNVTLGDTSITRERVEAALRDAGAWDFVMDRTSGLDSMVGSSGGMLSGGQRQRLAIARALVRQPKLLILDEVTAALDQATEAAICETLAQLKSSVTIVAISHQDALRDAADIVYRIEHGKVRVAVPQAAQTSFV